MSAKRPAAVKERAYVEIDINKLKNTGEVQIISSPIIAPEITTKVPRGKFEIVYTAELFDIVGELGNAKVQVLMYLLDNKDGNNCINASNTQLAKTIGVSRPTVVNTIKVLEAANLAKRQGTVVMISPGLMVKGSQMREAYLMRRFIEADQDAIDVEATATDTEVDNQIQMIGVDGDNKPIFGEKAR